MGRKYVLVDDLTGDELPDDTTPLRVTVGRRSYTLYLSDTSLGKFNDALAPFVENADSEANKQPAANNKPDRERTRAVREWAQAEGIKQPNGKPLGDRGRIPQEIIDAYDEKH